MTRPRVVTPTIGMMPTESDTALLVPAPWTNDLHPISFILAAVHTALAEPDPVLLFVGHAASGEPPELALARANGVRNLIDGDRAAWIDLATDHGRLDDVVAYLQYLADVHGWPCGGDVEQEVAVERFQAEYNDVFEGDILVDGVCGRQTLGAVFDVLADEWTRWLDKHSLSVSDVESLEIHYLDASEVEPSSLGDLAGKPGVHALVIPREALRGQTPSAALVYHSALARHLEYPVPPEPGAWARGPYTIITDLLADESAAREVYTLTSTDGQLEQRRALPDDAEDEGVLVLKFSDLPTDKHYTLQVTVHDRETFELFSDVPYRQLHRLATEEA